MSERVVETLPYGTWPSPITARNLAEGRVRLGDVVADDDRLVWTESRPSEGRQVVVAWDRQNGMRDLGPADFHARTLVHESGGGTVAAGAAIVVASRLEDQRLYRLGVGTAEPLTEEPPVDRGYRYADGCISADGRWLVCVREDHHGPGEPRNEVVAIDLSSGAVTPIVAGRDFVAAPRLAPDGATLAWLAWDHPYMPWDAAELWVASFAGEALTGHRRVRGGHGDAAVWPTWSADGRLFASFDATGFWELYRCDGPSPAQLTDLGADIGGPQWTFKWGAIAPLADGRVVVRVTEHATDRLAIIEPDGTVSPLAVPHCQVMPSIVPFGDGVAFAGFLPDGDAELTLWSPRAGSEAIRRVPLRLDSRMRATAEHVTVGLPTGDVTHAFVYAPSNAGFAGPHDELPPLVVFTHGGPTSHASPVFKDEIAYWTTRGFAVADVNYRGSSGHGRAYRESLYGNWGLHDVEDTIAVAKTLAQTGVVDRQRTVIRGGSAGGFTTLSVLTMPDHPFAAGTSFFGVADLVAMRNTTHKFESQYYTHLLGPYPEAEDVYVERSPITHADGLSKPLLVLQGTEDRVVPPAQAERIVRAAAERGVPHAYIRFEGEQHGFRRADSIVTWLESELAFYGQVLGFEPAGQLPKPLPER